nr:MAG TPA: hypothetical protein [Caudoviricetes sp.]
MWRSYCERANSCGLIEIDCYSCPFLGKLDEDFYNSIEMFNKVLKMNSGLSGLPFDTSDLKNLF